MARRIKEAETTATDMVPMQVMVPSWLKVRCVEAMKRAGKTTLSDWVRDVLMEATDKRRNR